MNVKKIVSFLVSLLTPIALIGFVLRRISM